MTPGRWILWLLVLPLSLAMEMILVIGFLERAFDHEWVPVSVFVTFGVLGVLATTLTVVALLFDIRAAGDRAHPA